MPAGRLLAGLLLALVLLQALATHAAEPPTAVAGRLALSAVPQAPVPLRGQWGFAWQRFLEPSWQALPARAFAPVPDSWNDVTADGKPPGPDGWGSYVLQLDCPAGQAMAVEAMGQRTASQLFVNGTLVARHGRPGPPSDGSSAAIHQRVPISREFACPLRITLHVSNHEHRAGGFVRPIMAGTADALARQRERRVVYEAALLTTYLLTGVVALIFFAFRRRERTPLLYGLFCLAMALYTDLIAARLLLPLLPGQTLGWVPYMRAEYLSWIAAMALFFLTLRGLFPAEVHRRAVLAVMGILAMAAVAVLALPPAMYSQLARPGQAAAVGVGIYMAWVMLRAHGRNRTDARLLLGGLAAVLVTLAIDLLWIDAPGPDRKSAPIGFALFLLSPALVIARRMSHALNAEERSRTLEENARLREDVERISRHDLKTPLTSVLGVTRLLRDDPRLGTEQRELVGVLQRASHRMLEMVNLSLGLYRMETGSYDFRPQAVDLQEVATRVLVDLHSYAEASRVALHLRGSDRTPVYVRGEELLCYSIVANLVKNAVEASAPGQQVTLSLARGDPATLTVHNARAVPPEIASRFFQKYVTAGKSGGTGLGTYSARLMARAQEGELTLHTGVAEGTTLTLSLRPLREEPVLAQPAVAADRTPGEWAGVFAARDLLLVDDDEYTRLVTRRFLPSPPFSVETASNGQAAIEAMTRRWPQYLLVDMEMPVLDGIATVQWMRAQEAAGGRPRCQVVMLSGNDDAASAQRARAAGADRYLVKPVPRETLLATLQELEQELAARPDPGASVAAQDPASGPADEVVRVDPEWVEFFPEFVSAQRDTIEAMGRALAAGDREDVRFLAHRATGGLATMGLEWAARQCRSVEKEAHDAAGEVLERRIQALRLHLRKVRIESA